jgi:hypothetical protein
MIHLKMSNSTKCMIVIVAIFTFVTLYELMNESRQTRENISEAVETVFPKSAGQNKSCGFSFIQKMGAC